jgi:hypothetical protein
MMDKVALGQVFSGYFGSPANSHSIDSSTFIIIIIYHPGAGTIGQLVADVPSGLSLTQSQETKNKKKLLFGLLIACLAYSATIKMEAVTFLRNVGKLLPFYMAAHARKQNFSPQREN